MSMSLLRVLIQETVATQNHLTASLNCTTMAQCAHSLQASNVCFLQSDGFVAKTFIKHIAIMQGECAAIDLSKEPSDVVVSSQDATTCCIAILRCMQSRRLFITHLDAPEAHKIAFVRKAVDSMTRPDLWLLGSCAGGANRTGSETHAAEALLWALHRATLKEVVVQLALVGEHNTDACGMPRSQSLCYDHGLRRTVTLAARYEGAIWGSACMQHCGKHQGDQYSH
jgi:Protein N-terminal asparagine amidohydrolase